MFKHPHSNRSLSKAALLVTALVSALALLVGACSSDPGGSPGITGGGTGNDDATPDPAVVLDDVELDDIELVAALRSFADCDALLDYLRTETVSRVGPYGLDRGPGFGIPEFATEESAVADMADGDDSAIGAGGDGDNFSDTNVQVAGVDEPDVVKTDGARILAVAQGHLHYVDVSGDQPRYRGRVDLSSGTGQTGQEIFVRGDRAMVFSSTYAGRPEPFGGQAEDDAFWGNSVTLVQEVDLSDPSAMTVVSELRVEGEYLSARSVGDRVWISVSSYKAQFQFVRPNGPAAEEFAERANKEIAARADLEAWLPTYRLDGPGGRQSGLLPACERLYSPPEFSGFTVLSVLSLNLAEPLSAGDASSVLADGQTLYGSGQSLYLASSSPVSAEPAEDGPTEPTTPGTREWRTDIHKFSVPADGPARYEASGSVSGDLLNQFSMDEHNGYFRVATTIGDSWNTENSESSESQVVVLEQQGRRLTEVGKVDNLGRGERIFSVRFMGDTGYVVTFRQVDPLYVLDLSDPTAPSVTGELKIPGFSTYLHPLGGGLLLGVGQDTDEDGRTVGTKVSLFDVSNPSAPTELDVIVFPDANSRAEWDHRAFLYWAPEEMVAIPLTRYNDYDDGGDDGDRDESFLGAVTLRANRDGITEIGRVTHRRQEVVFEGCRLLDGDESARAFGGGADLINICPAAIADRNTKPGCHFLDPENAREGFPSIRVEDDEKLLYCWSWTPTIQRLIVIGDTLWTMSENALQANDLDTLAYREHFSLESDRSNTDGAVQQGSNSSRSQPGSQ